MSITIDHLRMPVQKRHCTVLCVLEVLTSCCKLFLLTQSLSCNWQTVTCLRTDPCSIDMRTVFVNICKLDCPWLGDGKDIDCLESKLIMSYNLYLSSRVIAQKYTVGWNVCRRVGNSNANPTAYCFQKPILCLM